MSENDAKLENKELATLVKDLQFTKRSPGWIKVSGFTVCVFILLAASLSQTNLPLFLLFGTALGFVYASFMILTHDAIHHTLTGSRISDEIIPRLMSWPMFWPHGTYSSIHKFHHNMNGRNELDPERCHLTTEEYSEAGMTRRFIARHQLLFRVFFAGGIGMIFNLYKGCRPFYKKSAELRRQIYMDLAGIFFLNLFLYSIATYFGLGFKLFLIWIILERVVGGVQQLRSHLEHYGLWNFYPNFIESQIYNTRNINTNDVASFFFNGLNYHSVHHAFPSIPFYHLKEAHGRIKDYCNKRGAPLHEENGYTHVALSIIKHPQFVAPFHKGTHFSATS